MTARPALAALAAAWWLLAVPPCAAQDGKLALGEVKQVVPASAAWQVVMPAADKLDFRGAVAFDGAGLQGRGILYPAPNLVGFLAAVLTHGAIASSEQERQKARMREEADKVLEPYRPALDKLLPGPLAAAALVRMRAGGSKRLLTVVDPTGADWVVEMAPVFSLTQDERALVLDNAVSVRSPGAKSAVVYQNVVRVVSLPRPASNDKAAQSEAWLADDARLLAHESASLLAESLDLVLGDLARGPGAAAPEHRTLRFPEGGTVRIERATVLVERCDRAEIRTLRGWLMSVPRTAPEPCPAPAMEGADAAAKAS